MNNLTKIAPSTIYQNSNEIELREIVGMILSGKWLILFLAIIFMLLAFVYASDTTTIYKGDLLLKVESEKAGIPGLQELTGLKSNNTSVGTELEIIKTRNILGPTIEKLKLDIWAEPKRIQSLSNLYRRYLRPNDMEKPNFIWEKLNTHFHQYAWGNEKIKVDSLSVPDYLINRTLELVARDKNEYDILLKDQLLLKGKVNEVSTSNDGTVKIFVSVLNALPGTTFNLSKLSQQYAIKSLRNNLKGSEVGDNTGILKLTLYGGEKRLIVKTLDFISNTYLEQIKSRSTEDASNALKFLNDQIEVIKEKADTAEAQLLKYRTNNQTADISIETSVVLAAVSNIETELQQVSVRRNELEQKYASNHPIIQSLKTQKEALEKRKADYLLKVTNLPQKQQKLINLEAEYNLSNSAYLNLLNNIQEYKIAKTSNESNVYIIDSAIVEDSPVSASVSRTIVIGTLIGAILGVALTFLRKVLNPLVSSPEKIEGKFGLPVYATIPRSRKVNLTFGLNNKNRKAKRLLALEYGGDPAIDSLRSFRTSLYFALHEAKNNIVMITGITPSVGKSFISSNLSAVVAASKQRVLLIDADMRKGYLHSLFNKEASPGLSDLINGNNNLDDTIQTITIGDMPMDVIFRGEIPPNPSELLMYNDFEKILTTVSNNYDV